MANDRTLQRVTHLTLALAGGCLTVAEWPYLPELVLGLLVYLALLCASWKRRGTWTLSVFWANVLGLGIAIGTAFWVYVRLDLEESWTREIPFAAMLVPYLGPVVMALLLVRLFRPRTPGDFWLLQGLGLVQVALGCVLADGALFGVVLLAYLAVGLVCLALGEHREQRGRAAGRLQNKEPSWSILAWAGFSLRWMVGLVAIGLPLFLLTPRVGGPEWDPLQRFGVNAGQKKTALTGFSDEMDLNRDGVLEIDPRMAFTVSVTDRHGMPRSDLPSDQRWRGTVLDTYSGGRWTMEQTVAGRPPPLPLGRVEPEQGPGTRILSFTVSGKVGGLFLADPVRLGDFPGQLPIRGSLFAEIAGTALPRPYLIEPQYRYRQFIDTRAPRDRYPQVRVSGGQDYRMVMEDVPGLRVWTEKLLRDLVARQAYRRYKLATVIPDYLDRQAPIDYQFWEPVAQMLADYLAHSGEFGYTLKLRRQSRDIDPILDFLTNVKQGHCERFAAALTLMLRTQRIPARIVKGFRGCDPQSEGEYIVRHSHAHAWVEVKVLRPNTDKKFDWLILDPTPDQETAESSTLARWWQQGKLGGRTLWNELIIGYNANQQQDLLKQARSGQLFWNIAGWLGGGVFLFVAFWLWRRYRRRLPRNSVPRAETLYSRLLALLARLGWRPGIGQTPREFATWAGAGLRDRGTADSLAAVPEKLVELYYRARFGKHPPDEEELRRVDGELRELAGAVR